MSLIPLWVKALIVFAILAACAWGVNAFLNYEQNIGYQKAVAEYNVKLVAAQTAAAEESARLNKEKDDAIKKRIAAEKASAEIKRAASDASNGLRDTINNLRQRLSSDSIEAIRSYADAGLRLLGTCQERYRVVAERAKSHYADEVMFDQAWPK